MGARRRRLNFDNNEEDDEETRQLPIPSPETSPVVSPMPSEEEESPPSPPFPSEKWRKRKYPIFEDSDSEKTQEAEDEARRLLKMKIAGCSFKPPSPDVWMPGLGKYDTIFFAGKKLVVTPNYNRHQLALMPPSLNGENSIDQGFLYVVGIVLKQVLRHLPFGDWWNLKATCKFMRDRPEWSCVKFLQDSVEKHRNNDIDAGRFKWDPKLINEKFVRDCAKAIARSPLLGVDAESKQGRSRDYFTTQEPNKLNININWRRRESQMFVIEPPYGKSPTLQLVQLPACAPRRYSRGLVLINSTKFVRIYRPRDFSVSASIAFHSMKKSTCAMCNSEGTRILVFFHPLDHTDAASKRDAQPEKGDNDDEGEEKDDDDDDDDGKIQDKRATDVEILALTNKGLSPYRRVHLPSMLNMNITRKCLWPEEGIVVVSRDTYKKPPVKFSLLDVSSSGRRIPSVKATFTPHKLFTNIYEHPDVHLEPLKYQTLIPCHGSNTKPILCRLRSCESLGVTPIPDHKLIFYDNPFSVKQTEWTADTVPIRYTVDLGFENDVKALARVHQGVDMILILTRAVKTGTEPIDQPCSFPVKKYLPTAYSKDQKKVEDEEKMCTHRNNEWYGRDKILRLFVWVVGSETVQCVRYMYAKSCMLKADSIMMYHTDFDSALQHSGCAPSLRILTDGYQIVIPSNYSFYHTSLTNLSCCIEMQYNTHFSSVRMPFVFLNQGVMLQATFVERKEQHNTKNRIKAFKEANKLLIHIKVHFDDWTAKQTFNDERFFFLKTSKTLYGIRPPMQNVASHSCSEYEMMVADRIFPKPAEGRKQDKERADKHSRIIRLIYRNIGSVPTYLCTDDN